MGDPYALITVLYSRFQCLSEMINIIMISNGKARVLPGIDRWSGLSRVLASAVTGNDRKRGRRVMVNGDMAQDDIRGSNGLVDSNVQVFGQEAQGFPHRLFQLELEQTVPPGLSLVDGGYRFAQSGRFANELEGGKDHQ